MATTDISKGPIVFSVKEIAIYNKEELKVQLSCEGHGMIMFWVPMSQSPEFFLGREFNVTIEPKPIVPPPDSRQMLIPGTEEKPLTGGDSDVV